MVMTVPQQPSAEVLAGRPDYEIVSKITKKFQNRQETTLYRCEPGVMCILVCNNTSTSRFNQICIFSLIQVVSNFPLLHICLASLSLIIEAPITRLTDFRPGLVFFPSIISSRWGE